MAIQKIQETTTVRTATAGELSTGQFGRLSLRNPVFNSMEFALVPSHVGHRGDPGYNLEVNARVPHRETGKSIEIRSVKPLSWEEILWPDVTRAAELVRHQLYLMARHEIDEMLLLDGGIYRDPHR